MAVIWSTERNVEQNREKKQEESECKDLFQIISKQLKTLWENKDRTENKDRWK